MAASHCIQCRVTAETKARIRALAYRHRLTESALLMRLVDLALLQEPIAGVETPEPIEPIARGTRLYVRLRPDDHALLRERSAARRMAAATYGALVLAAHLRARTPLPTDELRALKESVSQLGAIGRYLRRIVHVADQGVGPRSPSRAALMALLQACSALRDHVKALVKANQASWEGGHARTTD